MEEIITPLAKEVYHALDCFLDDTSKTQTFDLFKRENFRLALKVQELEQRLELEEQYTNELNKLCQTVNEFVTSLDIDKIKAEAYNQGYTDGQCG